MHICYSLLRGYLSCEGETCNAFAFHQCSTLYLSVICLHMSACTCFQGLRGCPLRLHVDVLP